MKPKTEQFLYHLLWGAEQLMRPTFRNLSESYEGWAYRSGFLRQLGTVEKARLIERDRSQLDERVYRLTEPGRLHALGGRDPVALWSRSWDGHWHFVLFDLPVAQNTERKRLCRLLGGRGFGCLQKSVWITPDPLREERVLLSGKSSRVASLLLLEGRPEAGESDAEIVEGAWDFSRINAGYRQHEKVLNEFPGARRGNAKSKRDREAIFEWATRERMSWLEAVKRDPLLPACLLPPEYLGQSTWERRVEVLRLAGKVVAALQG